MIQLLSIIKTSNSSHPLSTALRTQMVTLTNATQEYIMLLHVSSFSPAPTPRPYSPMVGVLPPTPGHPPLSALVPVFAHATTPVSAHGTPLSAHAAAPLSAAATTPLSAFATTPTYAVSPASAPEDGRLGANLSRSRSAVPAPSSRLAPALRDPPRSAQPHLNPGFKLATPPRVARSPDE